MRSNVRTMFVTMAMLIALFGFCTLSSQWAEARGLGLADVQPRWQLGDAWTVEVQVLDQTGSVERWRKPSHLTYVVSEEAMVDSHEVWLVIVFDETLESVMASAYFRKSNMQLLRIESGPAQSGASTLDFVADNGTAVLLDGVSPPLSFPCFSSRAAIEDFEYVPVINERWGFPRLVSQHTASTVEGVQIVLQRGSRLLMQEWTMEAPWWTRSEEPGIFIAETVDFFHLDLKTTASTAGQPSVLSLQRQIAPPIGRWWPTEGEAATKPWAMRSDSVSPMAIPSPNGQATKTPWSGTWWPACEYNDPNRNTYATNGLLYKYDEYFRITRGTYPSPQKARDWELANFRLQPSDPGAGWWGHCDGWCAAAILKPEPTTVRTISGLSFDVGDLKGLLSEAYIDCLIQNGRLFGNRYNSDSNDGNDPPPYDFHKWSLRDRSAR